MTEKLTVEQGRDRYIASLTPEERKAKAVKAAKTRWANTTPEERKAHSELMNKPKVC